MPGSGSPFADAGRWLRRALGRVLAVWLHWLKSLDCRAQCAAAGLQQRNKEQGPWVNVKARQRQREQPRRQSGSGPSVRPFRPRPT